MFQRKQKKKKTTFRIYQKWISEHYICSHQFLLFKPIHTSLCLAETRTLTRTLFRTLNVSIEYFKRKMFPTNCFSIFQQLVFRQLELAGRILADMKENCDLTHTAVARMEGSSALVWPKFECFVEARQVYVDSGRPVVAFHGGGGQSVGRAGVVCGNSSSPKLQGGVPPFKAMHVHALRFQEWWSDASSSCTWLGGSGQASR